MRNVARWFLDVKKCNAFCKNGMWVDRVAREAKNVQQTRRTQEDKCGSGENRCLEIEMLEREFRRNGETLRSLRCSSQACVEMLLQGPKLETDHSGREDPLKIRHAAGQVEEGVMQVLEM